MKVIIVGFTVVFLSKRLEARNAINLNDILIQFGRHNSSILSNNKRISTKSISWINKMDREIPRMMRIKTLLSFTERCRSFTTSASILDITC